MHDLTVVYYTANNLPEKFDLQIKHHLLQAIGDLPLISVSQKKIDFGANYCIGEIGRSHVNIYKQALIGAHNAKTKYIALVEDDVLYSPDHFKYRPHDGVFSYNMSVWSMYTWVKPAIFSYKDRRNLSQLICERELFLEAMEERFKMYPDDASIPLRNWAEPGKYEGNLGVTERQSEKFYTNIPNIAFSHETALSFLNLGKRKKLGNLRATALPYWGTAQDILSYYE